MVMLNHISIIIYIISVSQETNRHINAQIKIQGSLRR